MEVAKLFDSLADTYDNVGVPWFQPIARGLVDELAPRAGESALDVGCGRGAVLLPLAAAVAPEGRAVGIDVSPRMVELARVEAAKADVDVDARVGDAMAVDLEPNSFDLVASSLVLFFLPDPLAALQGWRELLGDGGRIGLSTFGPYDRRWRDEVDGALQANLPADVADARTSGARGPFASDEGMEDLLREAGFVDVRTATITVGARFEDPDHWFDWSMSVGQRRLWASIPDDRRPDVLGQVKAAVARCRTDDGRLGFDQQVRYTLGVRQA